MTLSLSQERHLADVKEQRMRDVVSTFLAKTPTLHLERELVKFLLDIDRQHSQKLSTLERQLHSILEQHP